MNPTKHITPPAAASSVRAPRRLRKGVIDITPGKVYPCNRRLDTTALFTITDDVGYRRLISIGYTSQVLNGGTWCVVAMKELSREQ